MDFRCLDTQNGPGPGIAPLAVGDHLALVDDRHVVDLLQVQLFGGGGHVGVLLPAVLLLPGGEGAVHPCFQQNFLGFQGQQAQGGQVDPRGGGLQPLEPGIGLAGVGASDVEDEPAGHGTGFRVLVLGVQGHEDFQTGADGPGHEDNGIQIAQGSGEKLLFGKVLHGQQGV